ncbi:hypothetical protein I6F11_07405 [Ensifer sp. NBAIM29]|nr:hypothetical protein [Ensifer sp. NBAIM29]
MTPRSAECVWYSLSMLALFFSGAVERALDIGRTALQARPDWPALRLIY